MDIKQALNNVDALIKKDAGRTKHLIPAAFFMVNQLCSAKTEEDSVERLNDLIHEWGKTKTTKDKYGRKRLNARVDQKDIRPAT